MPGRKKRKSEKELTARDIQIGGIVTEPGSACEYMTGDWRSEKPIVDFQRCNKCTLCQIFCPEGCIKQTAEGYFVADMDYCKGCGICAVECPTKAIKMESQG